MHLLIFLQFMKSASKSLEKEVILSWKSLENRSQISVPTLLLGKLLNSKLWELYIRSRMLEVNDNNQVIIIYSR